MAAHPHDLRPRTAVELFDAAIRLVIRGETALPAACLSGTVPLAVAALCLLWWSRRGDDEVVRVGLALFTGAALLLRAVAIGAASLTLDAALEGRPMPAGEALSTALRRLPSLAICGGVLLLHLVAVPLSLGLSRIVSAPSCGALSLVARGESTALSATRMSRRLLDGLWGKALGLEGLQLLAFVLVVLNTHVAVQAALWLARGSLDADVAFLARFASFDNVIWVASLAAAGACLLDPVRAAASHLLLLDAKVRRDGLDLLSAARSLREEPRRPSAGAAAAALVAALVAGAGSASAQAAGGYDSADEVPEAAGTSAPSFELVVPPDADVWDAPEDAELAPPFRTSGGDPRDRLVHAARWSGASDEAVEALRRWPGQPAELSAWADAVEQELSGAPPWEGEERDLALERVAAQLEHGSRGLSAPHPPPPFDPSTRIREILALPEFQDAAHLPDLPGPPKIQTPTFGEELRELLRRFARWLKELLEGLDDDGVSVPRTPGVPAELFELLAFALLAVALCLGAVLLLRAARARRKEAPAATAHARASVAAAVEEHALARTPAEWWAIADELAARGEHRLAIRALYLAVLSALHRRGAIDYDPHHSNWDYHRAFGGAAEERERFGELTLRFDWSWYGRIGADRDGYDRFRGLALPLGRAAEGPPP